MTQSNRRFRLIVDQAAAVDLARVKKESPFDHARIVALLLEYEAGTFPAEDLIDEHFASDDIENVVPFWYLQRRGLNVYRLKMITVRGWRILTAGDHLCREVAVLAIMRRDQDYEKDTQLIERIRASYDSFGYRYSGR